MLARTYVAIAALCIAASPAMGQRSPYIGRQDQPIKALTQQEIDAYLAGDGMGFALAAELNGYPGPRHVLDLADSLALSAERRAVVRRVFDRMHGEAVQLGDTIVGLEASLDSAFAQRRIRPTDLETRLARLADLRGRLRYVHLNAHLAVTALLSPDEVEAYRRLRGYHTGHDAGHQHRGMPEQPDL